MNEVAPAVHTWTGIVLATVLSLLLIFGIGFIALIIDGGVPS